MHVTCLFVSCERLEGEFVAICGSSEMGRGEGRFCPAVGAEIAPVDGTGG